MHIIVVRVTRNNVKNNICDEHTKLHTKQTYMAIYFSTTEPLKNSYDNYCEKINMAPVKSILLLTVIIFNNERIGKNINT